MNLVRDKSIQDIISGKLTSHSVLLEVSKYNGVSLWCPINPVIQLIRAQPWIWLKGEIVIDDKDEEDFLYLVCQWIDWAQYISLKPSEETQPNITKETGTSNQTDKPEVGEIGTVNPTSSISLNQTPDEVPLSNPEN